MLTKKDFEMLNTHDFYVIVSALRGPDGNCENLKFIFTARIRHLINIKSDDITIRKHKTISADALYSAFKDATKMSSGAFRHYYSHNRNALEALLRNKLIDIKEYSFLKNMLDAIFHCISDVSYRDADPETAIQQNFNFVAKDYPKFIRNILP